MVQDIRSDQRGSVHSTYAVESASGSAGSASAVTWAAIFAGALGAVAASLILVELGIGLGLSSVSAWNGVGAAASTIGIAGGLWLIFVQWFASGVGGYLAGRLRTKWVGIHTDEAFFRDTAHGFLAWAVATVIGVFLLAVAASSALKAGGEVVGAAASGATQLAAGAAQGAAQGASQSAGSQSADAGGSSVLSYYTDRLLRPGNPSAGANGSTSGANAAADNSGDRREIMLILTRDLAHGDLAPEDRTYIAQTIAARTGISQDDAEKRVDDAVAQVKNAETQARQAAETARKASASGAIITALAMVVGAFIASAAAALGGRLRDDI
jgi:hypothetical protein